MCIMFWKKKERIQSDKKGAAADSEVYIVEAVNPVALNKEKKEKIQKYHVSQNKDKDAESYMKWRVRKEGSDKTIQYFDTQKMAIEYAQGLASRIGTTVVIHKLDGSIRKQDYTTKN